MPKIEEQTRELRKALNIFYVIDTSGSMRGDRIDTLNTAMEKMVDVFADKDVVNANAFLKISVLEFSTGCSWITPNGPEETEDFFWRTLSASGTTDLGSALEELNSKLSEDEYLKSSTGVYFPIIIFMTDGEPTDDYMKELEKIRKNKWYRKATKIGFAIGDDANASVLAQVIGNSEVVIRTNDLKEFTSLLKFTPIKAIDAVDAIDTTATTTEKVIQGEDIS